MYLYHYMPALMVSMIIFGVMLEDVIFTKIHLTTEYIFKDRPATHIWEKSIEYGRFNPFSFVLYLGITTIVIVSYFFYFVTLHKDEFNQRNLVKDWGLKWPGK